MLKSKETLQFGRKTNLTYSEETKAKLEILLSNYTLEHYGKLNLEDINKNRRKIQISDLRQKQRKVYDIVAQHFKNTRKNKQQLKMIVCGGAGTGKSYVIDALANLLDSSVCLTGTTGVAAFNIQGNTIDSLLKLHVKKLSTTRLKELQENLKDIEYIIIDEMSMLGQKKLARLNRRLKEIKATDKDFGGINMIFVGDFAQLPPVGDRAMWKKTRYGQEGIEGYTLYRSIKTCVKLDEPQRQDDDIFLNMLERFRNGTVTEADWKILNKRNPNILKQKKKFPKNYDDFIRLFGSNEEVNNYNLLEKLVTLGNPIAKIKAMHSDSVAANTLPKNAWGLEPVLYLARGARVMLRVNLFTPKGLVNGSIGTVKDIIYDNGKGPDSLPKCVVVEFENYTGEELIPGHPKCVPIVPFAAKWKSNGKLRERVQFPLKLAWAITIHKSQGLTLKNAVIDIGDSDIASGCTYVALSRLETLGGLYFKGKTLSRLLKINDSSDIKQRIKEEKRLDLLESKLEV